MDSVIVVIGPGSIGQAIARRVGAGRHVLLADLRQENADAAADVLSNAGFEVSTATVDVVFARVGARAGRNGHCNRRGHRAHPRRRCVPQPGLTGHDPVGRPLRHGPGARGDRERHRLRWRRRGHRLPVRPPSRRPHRRAGRRPGHDADRGPPGSADAPARPGDGLSARVPAVQARELPARDGRSGPVGQAGCPDQHHQSRASSSRRWPRTS